MTKEAGRLGLRAGTAKYLWVKTSHHKGVGRLKIATYNVRSLLRNEQIQELEEELRETRFVWDVIMIPEDRRPKVCFSTSQRGHLLYYLKAKNGKAGVGFLINRKWKDHIVRVNSISPREAELVLYITKRYKLKIMQVYAPMTSYSD